MRVRLTGKEVMRALAKLAVEKANEKGFPYLWSDRVGVSGDLSEADDLVAVLCDGHECCVKLRRAEALRAEDGDEPRDVPY